jgi:hypothetical protein
MTKKIITLIIGTLLLQTASAQTYLELGTNYASMSFGKSNALLETKPIIGPKFGVSKYWGPKKIKLKTGLLFSSKGYKLPGLSGSDKISLYYLDIPINLSLNITKRLAVEAGPLLSAGILGIQNFNGQSEAVEFGEDGLRRADVGLNFDVNYTFSRLRIGMNVSHGAISIVETNGDPILNKVGNLYLGYRLTKK